MARCHYLLMADLPTDTQTDWLTGRLVSSVSDCLIMFKQTTTKKSVWKVPTEVLHSWTLKCHPAEVHWSTGARQFWSWLHVSDVSLLQHTKFKWSAHRRALLTPDNDPFIWISPGRVNDALLLIYFLQLSDDRLIISAMLRSKWAFKLQIGDSVCLLSAHADFCTSQDKRKNTLKTAQLA